MTMRSRVLGLLLLVCAAAVLPACRSTSSPNPDISKLLAVTDVQTGWFDAGIENGMLASIVKNEDLSRYIL